MRDLVYAPAVPDAGRRHQIRRRTRPGTDQLEVAVVGDPSRSATTPLSAE
ncbi:MAG TPA: hypothetical protein VMV12_02690 [Candidatus Micrarchaeaceae archaeon]|nr:hypothetical protein [Candidatus Micrarchaeaceae archaeon]